MGKNADSQKIKSLFKGKTDKTLIQIFRYLFVGGTAFVVDYVLLFVFTEFVHLHYLVASVFSFLISLIVNYLFCIFWVFHHNSSKSRISEFLVFLLIASIGLGLNTSIMYLFTDGLDLHYMLSKIISSFIVAFWNFFARKYFLYKVTINYEKTDQAKEPIQNDE